MLAQLTPVVKWLLIANLAIYFADLFFFDQAIRAYGAFAIQSAVLEGRVWEFLTFQFIHGNVGHVLMNSIGLFFFGPWMERWWGARKFILFYLACGVGGALFFTLLVYAGMLPGDGLRTGLIGASAGIYGILAGVAVIAPSLRVSLLFPPVTLSMRQLAIGLMAISAGLILFKMGGNEGGEAGHLGGAIMGFLLVKLRGMEGLAGIGGSPGRMQGGGERSGPRMDIEPKIRPRTRVDLRGQDEIDAILDKISKEGFQSLTDEEREVLQQAAKTQQERI